MTDEAHGADAAAASGGWGTWESAATTVLFSAPALLLFWKVRADPGGPGSGPAFDPLDWFTIGVALAGGFSLSLVAGGVRSARLYVTTGLSSCFAWLLTGMAFPSTAPLAEVYKPLVFADLAAHFNLLPLVLVNAAAHSRASLPERLVPWIRRSVCAVAVAAAGLDLSPLVWWLAPAGWGRVVALAWAGGWIATGGALAALTAAEIASHARPGRAEGA